MALKKGGQRSPRQDSPTQHHQLSSQGMSAMKHRQTFPSQQREPCPPNENHLSKLTSESLESQKQYHWDPQNLACFLSLRAQVNRALSATPVIERASKNVSYSRSQSGGLSSPINEKKKNGYSRSQSEIASSHAKKDQLHQFDESYHANMIKNVLPHPKDYFSRAVWFLFDTPLALSVSESKRSNAKHSVGVMSAKVRAVNTMKSTKNITQTTSSSCNDVTFIHLRQPHPNESVYLLPRLYLRKWFNWARTSVVNSNVEQWISQMKERRGDQKQGDVVIQERREIKLFLLNSHSLQILAALSVMADQYQLWNQEEEEWIRWFHELEYHWNDFIHNREQHYLDSIDSVQRQNQEKQCPSLQQDEKKNDDESAVSEPFFPHFIRCVPPGPIDVRLLSSVSHRLRLRCNVSLVMKGIPIGCQNVMNAEEEMKEESLIKFLSYDLDSLAAKNSVSKFPPSSRIAVSSVSTAFYEMIRSSLGVICEDGYSISFQSVSMVGSKISGSSLGGHDPTTLLYHDQSTPHSSPSPRNKNMYVDIHHPSATQFSSPLPNFEGTLLRPRPIEFPRLVLAQLLSLKDRKISVTNGIDSEARTSTYPVFNSEGMKETIAECHVSPKRNAVEVYPVEFHYLVVDSAMPETMNDKDASSVIYSSHGIALVSRVSLISDALNDLKHAVEPNKSSACIRLWRKSPYLGSPNSRSATLRGDGYDLIDIDSSDKEPQTVESWLGFNQSPLLTILEPVVVDLLVEIRNSPTSSWSRESMELGNRLQVGDFVDAQDTALNWYEAVVRELTPDTVKVHYFGWGSRWDGTLPRRKGIQTMSLSPPMPLWSKSSRWRDLIDVKDELEIRQSTSLVQRPKWCKAIVLKVGRESDSMREILGGAELEMNDTVNGIKVPLTLLHRKRQILVEVPQERNNCTVPSQILKQENGDPEVNPPFIRWVNLYGEEVAERNTHISSQEPHNTPVTVSYALESHRKPVEVMKSFNNLHGAGFVRESLRGVPPAPGSVGLHNLGNNCYMNSILQCINHIPPITQYFLKGEYLKDINKANPLGSGGRVATAYASFLNDVWVGEYAILAPRLLKQTVGFFAPQFNNNYQHDSQEFYQYLMDGLHEDLNRVRDKPYVEHIEAFGMKDNEAAVESWKKHLLRHDSIFVDYTQGMHRSHLTCPTCGKESIKFDVYSSISLPLVPTKERPSIPLEDCLDLFAAGEQLDEPNAWYCSGCKKHVCALKLITLWNTPDILVLHLKRFTFEKSPTNDGHLLRRKIDDKVNFPVDHLDLTSYIIGPKYPDAPPIYKLFGVSEHMGSTANSGHYTATVRNSKDGNWYRYNDSHVGTTSGDAAMTGGAYLLFYQRKKGSLKWAGLEKQMKMAMEDTDGFREVQGKKKKKNAS